MRRPHRSVQSSPGPTKALPPGPARAFRLLSLHPGPDISALAAAALLDAAVPETRQLLETLTGGHLLEEYGRDRYRFHDLVRVYAAECAQISEPEPDRAPAVRRLLTWYLHTADAFFRTFNPDNRHVPLDPPPPACRPPVFTTHRQAADWAQGELANLMPIVRLAAMAGDDASVWKFLVTLVPVFGIQRRARSCFRARLGPHRNAATWRPHGRGLGPDLLRRSLP